MTDTTTLQSNLLAKFVRSKQLDSLHFSLSTLLDLTKEGSIDLIIDQPNKSLKQKVSYLEKVIAELPSEELQAALKELLSQGNLEIFSSKYLPDFVKSLQRQAEKIQIINITVAIEFKEKDLEDLVKAFSKRIEQPAAFEVTVDPSLIGGTIIRFGNYISDYSLKTRLEQFRSEWSKAVTDKEV